MTFREKYCSEYGCAEREFAARVFRRCLHRRMVPFASLVALLRPEYFAPDWELVRRAGAVGSLAELSEEVFDFRNDARNQRGWRARPRMRLSTRRLQRLAQRLLGDDSRPNP